jgi:glutamate--cysteine ligase
MSLDSQSPELQPLTQLNQLTDWLAAAAQPVPRLIGLEHEKLMFPVGSQAPVPYLGSSGIGALMASFGRFGFQEIRERSDLPIIAMARGTETLSLEPGGQFELSGKPYPTVAEAQNENRRHALELKTAAKALGLRAVTLGYRPYGTLAQMPWMPKSRYRVMRETLGARGSMAHHMMLMTATGQTSLDWKDEADCARKMTVSARVSPVLVALFANSPIVNGQDSGFLSFRSHVWDDVDRARCGYFPAMLDGTFSYQSYVDWAVEAPLLFLRRQGEYLTPAMTFGQLMRDGFMGRPATIGDWVDHASTLFPEVRLKRVLEIRAADGNSVEMTGALAALMRGLLYSEEALDACLRLLPNRPYAEHLGWHRETQKRALKAEVAGVSNLTLAREVLAIAQASLVRMGDGDEGLLAPLHEIVERGSPNAQQVLDAFARGGDWLSSFEI